MSYFMIDVEANGQVPGVFSMISFGAVKVQYDLKNAPTFYSEVKPISDRYQPEALAVTKTKFEDTLLYSDPATEMARFEAWILENTVGKPMFISDNNGFDFSFISYYFWRFLDRNPFGHSSTNLNSLYKGMVKDVFKNCKHLRKTRHTHHPVDDCVGNCEALLEMKKLGLKIKID